MLKSQGNRKRDCHKRTQRPQRGSEEAGLPQPKVGEQGGIHTPPPHLSVNPSGAQKNGQIFQKYPSEIRQKSVSDPSGICDLRAEGRRGKAGMEDPPSFGFGEASKHDEEGDPLWGTRAVNP